MKAVILAAGRGTRMLPLTEHLPKPLLKVASKALIEHMLDALPEVVDEVVVIVGYKGEEIKKYLGNTFKNFKISYLEQKELGGTAYALKLAETILGEEKFILMYADDLHDKVSIENLIKHDLGILVRDVHNPEKFGVVGIEDGYVKNIVEKPEHPKTNLVAVGVYVFDKRIFDYYKEPGSNAREYYVTDMILELIKDHQVAAIPTNFWVQVSTPEDLKIAEEKLESK